MKKNRNDVMAEIKKFLESPELTAVINRYKEIQKDLDKLPASERRHSICNNVFVDFYNVFSSFDGFNWDRHMAEFNENFAAYDEHIKRVEELREQMKNEIAKKNKQNVEGYNL